MPRLRPKVIPNSTGRKLPSDESCTPSTKIAGTDAMFVGVDESTTPTNYAAYKMIRSKDRLEAELLSLYIRPPISMKSSTDVADLKTAASQVSTKEADLDNYPILIASSTRTTERDTQHAPEHLPSAYPLRTESASRSTLLVEPEYDVYVLIAKNATAAYQIMHKHLSDSEAGETSSDATGNWTFGKDDDNRLKLLADRIMTHREVFDTDDNPRIAGAGMNDVEVERQLTDEDESGHPSVRDTTQVVRLKAKNAAPLFETSGIGSDVISEPEPNAYYAAVVQRYTLLKTGTDDKSPSEPCDGVDLARRLEALTSLDTSKPEP